MQVQVLLAQGFGDDEDAFEVVGVCSTPQSLAQKKAKIAQDAGYDVVFRVEAHEVE